MTIGWIQAVTALIGAIAAGGLGTWIISYIVARSKVRIEEDDASFSRRSKETAADRRYETSLIKQWQRIVDQKDGQIEALEERVREQSEHTDRLLAQVVSQQETIRKQDSDIARYKELEDLCLVLYKAVQRLNVRVADGHTEQLPPFPSMPNRTRREQRLEVNITEQATRQLLAEEELPTKGAADATDPGG